MQGEKNMGVAAGAAPIPVGLPYFARKQRVRVVGGAGIVEPATIVRPDRTMLGWYVVAFDDGHSLCVHNAGIEAA